MPSQLAAELPPVVHSEAVLSDHRRSRVHRRSRQPLYDTVTTLAITDICTFQPTFTDVVTSQPLNHASVHSLYIIPI
jgi:hypothetical protein